MSAWNTVWSRLAAAAFAFAMLGGAASAQDIYTVGGIPVEATGASPTEACNAMLGQGKDVAWERMMRRMVPERDWARVPTPTGEQLDNLIAGFQLTGERRSSTKCSATMSYRFRGDLVKKHLREARVAYADKRAPLALVVPVWEGAEGKRLWEDDNPWRKAWRAEDFENELQAVQMPTADDGDKAALTADMDFDGRWSTYEAIAKKYGVTSVLVARARPAANETDVEVIAKLVQPIGTIDLSVGGVGDDQKSALKDATRNLHRAVTNRWLEQTALDNSLTNSIVVWCPFGSPQEWVAKRERLEKVQNLLDISVRKLTRSGATLALSYRGRDDQLARGLAAAGFGIYRANGQGRVLTAFREGEEMAIGGGDPQVEPVSSEPAPAPDGPRPN